jgi:hypothetical protein
MLIQHQHKPDDPDPGHCRECARKTDLLGHYHRVQPRSRRSRRPTGGLGGPARRDLGLWVAGGGLLLAAIALVTG